MKTIRVTDKGQIAIPQMIREKVGIKKGDELIIIQLDGKILLEKASEVEIEMKDDFSDILKLSEASLKEFWSSKEDDIWDRV